MRIYETPITCAGFVRSTEGKRKTFKLLGEFATNDYLAEYNGVKCHAIQDHSACCYYVDDVNRLLTEQEKAEVIRLRQRL